jgi:hypothetical protein
MTAPQAARTWAGSDNSVPRLGLREEWKYQYTHTLDAPHTVCNFNSEYYSDSKQIHAIFLNKMGQTLGGTTRA